MRARRKRITPGSSPGMSQAATKTWGCRVARRAAWRPASGPRPGKRSATLSTPRPRKRSGRLVATRTCGKRSWNNRMVRTAIGSPPTAANALSRPPMRTARPPATITPATDALMREPNTGPLGPVNTGRAADRAAGRCGLTRTAGGARVRAPPDGSVGARCPRARGRVSRPRALRDRAHRGRPVGGERHPALPRPGRPVDQARRATHGWLPALPEGPAPRLGGPPQPNRSHARAVGGARRRAPEPRAPGARRARGARRPQMHYHAERRQPAPRGGERAAARDPRQCDPDPLHRVRGALSPRVDRLRRAAAALPALPRHPEERHRVLRRAHPARRPRPVLRGGGAGRLHDRRRHVGDRLPGGAVPDHDPPAGWGPPRGEPLRVGDHRALPPRAARPRRGDPAAAGRAAAGAAVGAAAYRVAKPLSACTRPRASKLTVRPSS